MPVKGMLLQSCTSHHWSGSVEPSSLLLQEQWGQLLLDQQPCPHWYVLKAFRYLPRSKPNPPFPQMLSSASMSTSSILVKPHQQLVWSSSVHGAFDSLHASIILCKPAITPLMHSCFFSGGQFVIRPEKGLLRLTVQAHACAQLTCASLKPMLS